MKTLIPLTAMAALFASGSSFAQTPAFSKASGYYQFDGQAGGNIFVPALVESSVFSGAINGSTSTTLTFPKTPLNADPLVSGAFDKGEDFATHYVEFVSGPNAGPNAGVIIDIESNTGTTITLAANIADLNLANTETIRVRPHVTLKQVLADSESSLAAFTDNATFYSSDGTFVTYFYGGDGGTGWSSDFSNADGNDQPIPPGTGFILNLNTASPLTVVGEVKEEPTIVQLAAGVVNLVGPVNPLVDTSVDLDQTGFEDLAAFTDSITVYEPGSLTSFVTYFPLGDGTLSTDFSNPTTDKLDNTTGAFVIPGSATSVTLSPGFSISQ